MRRFLTLLRPLPLVLAIGWLAHPRAAHPTKSPGERHDALRLELASRGLATSVDGVYFVDPPPTALRSRWERPRALVRARPRDGRFDVYVVRTRQSPEGALFGVDDVFALTRTSAVDEEQLTATKGHAAWVIGGGDRVYRVELVDLAGERIPEGEKWSTLARLQQRITSWQRTGQTAGIGHRSFKLDPAARRATLSLGETGLRIAADGNTIDVPFDPSLPVSGGRFARETDRTLGRPGDLVTWAVDRARDLSWFGDERMQLTKAIAYKALDTLDRALGTVRRNGKEEPAGDVADLGVRPQTSSPTLATGWPPAAIPPPSPPSLEGEGLFIPLGRDPFVKLPAGAIPPLVTTYLRGDRSRQHSFVYVVGWDPRQVELDVVPGTEEPQSATGETGTGRVPRRPEVLSRFLGGFNGGFQSTHGDFGMMVDRSVLVPPKPYAATIARNRDGATSFGTWPTDLTIPDELVSFRQNLTPLIQDGKLNPYRRDFWGGVPQEWEDETRTVRSALCLTREGFILYFYATEIDHTHLGRTMLAARCDYGVHLDMNQGHTGLELYRVLPAAELPPLRQRLDGQWQAEGDVEGMPGWRFRGRRLVRNLQLMNFPRYIRRSSRDFFYLTLTPRLPPAPLRGGEPGEGEWTTEGLPQHGWPPALATTSVRPDVARPETKVRVLSFDPGWLRLAGDGEGAVPAVLAFVPAPTHPSPTALWLGGGRAVVADRAPSPDAIRVAAGAPSPAGPVAAALGINGDGKVLYAEVVTAADPARDGALLARLFDDAGCASRVFLGAPLEVGIGAAVDLSDHPVEFGAGSMRLVRHTAPRGRRLFPETPVVDPVEWVPMQRQTRHFAKSDASARAPAAAPPPASSLGDTHARSRGTEPSPLR